MGFGASKAAPPVPQPPPQSRPSLPAESEESFAGHKDLTVDGLRHFDVAIKRLGELTKRKGVIVDDTRLSACLSEALELSLSADIMSFVEHADDILESCAFVMLRCAEFPVATGRSIDLATPIVSRCAAESPVVVERLLASGAVSAAFEHGVNADAKILVLAQQLFYTIYQCHEAGREACRAVAHRALHLGTNDSLGERVSLTAAWLRLMQPIYRGLREPLSDQHLSEVVIETLVPLAKSQLVRSGDAGTNGPGAALSYSAELVECLSILVARAGVDSEASVATTIFRALFRHFDPTKPWQCANLFDVVVPLVDTLDGESFAAVHMQLLRMLSSASGSDHAQLAQRALRIWQLPSIHALAARRVPAVAAMMAPALARHGVIHWDTPTCIAILDAWEAIESLSDTAAAELAALMAREVRGGAEQLTVYKKQLIEKREEATALEIANAAARQARSTPASRTAALGTDLQRRRFVFGKTLGEGAFGTVRFARLIEPDMPPHLWHEFAIKEVRLAPLIEQRGEAALKREVQIHRSVSNVKGVAPLHCTFTDATRMYLVLDFYPGGDLFDAVVASAAFREERYTQWILAALLEIARAIQGVHEAGVYVGDVRSENCVIDADGHVALIDFGATMTIPEARSATSFSGTIEFCAPELLERIVIAEGKNLADPAAADWYAFGVMTVQLLTGALPFDASLTAPAIPPEVPAAAQLRLLQGPARPPRAIADAIASGKLPRVVEMLLEHDPMRRGGFADIVEDAHFKTCCVDGAAPQRPVQTKIMSLAGSRHSGRKQSMMWQQSQLIRAVQSGGSVARSMVDAPNFALPEEPSGAVQVRLVMSATSCSPRRRSIEDDPLSQFMTTVHR